MPGRVLRRPSRMDRGAYLRAVSNVSEPRWMTDMIVVVVVVVVVVDYEYDNDSETKGIFS